MNMDRPTLEYLENKIPRNVIKGSRVIEIGSLNVNGSIRKHVESMEPVSYTGVDIFEHESVDVICNAYDLLNEYMPNSFDVVISTEMLEHVEKWRTAINNMKLLVRPGGLIIISTRRPGFPQHDYPYDYWRYSKRNMIRIFDDFMIHYCKRIKGKGIVLIASKPTNPQHWIPIDLNTINLHTKPSYSFEGMNWLKKKLWITLNYRVLRNANATRKPVSLNERLTNWIISKADKIWR